MKVKILVATIVILAVLPSIFAGRKGERGGRGNRRRGNQDCGEWILGECIPKNGNCGKGKQVATREGENCRKTTKDIRCNVPCEDGAEAISERCRYEKSPTSQWGECDESGQMSMEKVLKDGEASTCAPTKTFQKPCKKGKKKGGRKANKLRGCKFNRGDWSDCVEGQKTRVDSLKKQKPGADCPAERTKTRKCSPGSA